MRNKPKHANLEEFTELLNSNERITLSKKKYFRIINSFLLGLLLVSLVSISTFLYSKHTSAQIFILLGGIGVMVFLMLYSYARRVRSASIIGDSLIMTTSRKKPFVTTLNTVKKVTTYNFLTIHCTFLTYSLDGRIHKTILIGNPPGIAINLDNFILHAKQWSKNKRQTISRVQ